MSIFVNQSELEAVRNAPADTQIGRLYAGLRSFALEKTAAPTLVQPTDTQEWWHLVWERMSETSFVHLVETGKTDSAENAALGKWIHDRTLEICNKDIDEWVGPWFRERKKPLMGMLETAHIVNAIADVYDLCPDLFNDSEKAEILAALREKGLPLCKRFTFDGFFCNWYAVLCGGYASAAVILGEKADIERSVELYNKCLKLYDSDGYGETLQYGNYASLSLSHMREVLVRYDASLAEKLPLDRIAGTVKWAVSSFFYMKPLGGERGDTIYPRSANFGDCAAVFRPTGDVLTQISAEFGDETVAGLARWLFDTTYADNGKLPDELATFGFFNQYQYHTLLYLLRSKSAVSPSETGMELKNIYHTGTATIRDHWENPETILAFQCGYDTHTVDAHRHRDQNSFILAHGGERFFADPGHCCYRLETWRKSCASDYHNTWDFTDEAGNKYTQLPVKANKPPLNRLVEYPKTDGFDIVASDCAKAYGEHFTRCERVFITAFPEVMFMLDRIEADIPVKICSHFVLNNRDNKLSVHIADPVRLVLRRGNAGVKFFTFSDETLKMSQRWGFIHDNYHPLPNQLGQGREGSSFIYDYTSENFSRTHINVHAFAMSGTETVKGWHIKADGESRYVIKSPGDKKCYILELRPDEKVWFRAEVK